MIGSLQALGEIEGVAREVEALFRIARKQADVFGVAMRGVGAFEDVALLGTRRHAGRRTHALDVEQHGGYFGVVREPQEFVHQRHARAGGGGERTRAIPVGA